MNPERSGLRFGESAECAWGEGNLCPPSAPAVSGWRTGRHWAEGILIEERLLDVPVNDRGGHRRQVGREPEVQQDLAHDLQLGDEGEDHHRRGAPRTRQGVEEEDSSQ